MTTKAHFEAIGRVAYQWSRLEMALQTAIAVAAGIHPSKALIITNAGSVRSWADALPRMVEYTKREETICRRTRKLCERIAEKLYPKRNFVIHGLWQVSWDELFEDKPILGEANRSAHVHAVKKSGKHMLVGAELKAADVRAIADEIKEALDELQELTFVLAGALPDRQP